MRLAVPDADEQPVPPPDPADVYRRVGELVVWMKPNAARCRIVVDGDDGDETVIGIPLHPTGVSEYDAEIMTAMKRFRAGEWVGRKELAAALGVSPLSGQFRRRLTKMAAAGGMLESHQTKGYRLRE